jgi:hypothetical protein
LYVFPTYLLREGGRTVLLDDVHHGAEDSKTGSGVGGLTKQTGAQTPTTHRKKKKETTKKKKKKKKTKGIARDQQPVRPKDVHLEQSHVLSLISF